MSNITRCAALLLTAAAVASCFKDDVQIVTGPTPTDSLFASYVSIGNSITAGYQSGGINDSTQRQSYAYLLATQAMHTRFAYPSIAMPGCTPPTANLQTGALVANAPAGTCALRSASSATAILNNVAVPGATSLDPTSPTTSASNALTGFILGGKTQVQRAAEARPTFVSVWIGNNDVLAAGVSGVLTPLAGVSPGVTSVSQFQTNFAGIMNAVKAIPTLKGGVLIGVVQVSAAPVLFPAQALLDPTFKAGFDQYAGGTTTLSPNCVAPPGIQSLISFQIIPAMRAGTHPRLISCVKNSPGIPAPVGDVFVLDVDEQASLKATIDAYNSFIQSQASANNFAYVDPNPILARLKASGCVTTVPNLASATATFGNCVTLDGVHPSRVAHVEVANAIVTAVNAKYGTKLTPVQ